MSERKPLPIKDCDLVNVLNNKKATKAKQDLLYLSQLLSVDRKKLKLPNLITEETHGELCRLLDQWKKHYSMFLMPRGTLKSVVITRNHTIQRLLNNPDLRVLIYCETNTKAVKYVRELRDMFENPNFIEIFGNLKDPSFWREDGFRLSGKTLMTKEANVEPGGVDKPATGTHFDLIVCDDLLGETNTNTEDQIKKVTERFGELQSLLNPGGQIIIVGTIWDEQDLYCNLIRKSGLANENGWEEYLTKRVHETDEWNVYIRRAKEGDKLSFPDILSQEALDKIASNQTDKRHSLQYYNDPTLRVMSIFKKEWIQGAIQLWETYKDVVAQKVKFNILLVDPAISKSDKADYTGLVVIGVAEGNVWFVRDAIMEKYDPTELVEAVVMLRDRYNCKRTYVETIGFQKVIVSWIKEWQKKNLRYFNIEEYNPGTKKSKESKIEMLVPRFRQGRVAINPDLECLISQLERYSPGKLKHDDVIDALSMGELTIKNMPTIYVHPEDQKEYRPLIASTGV